MTQSEDESNKPAAQDKLAPVELHPTMFKIIHFTDIARCGDEVWIEYKGQLYRLQSTRLGKLVLTK